MLGPSAATWLGALLSVRAAAPVPEPAPAPAPGVVLEWSAPPRCPSAVAVQERLTRALAASAADPRGLRALATITEGPDGTLALALALDRDDGPVGRRTLRASDCDALATAAVLIVALAVDPAVVIDETPIDDPPPDDPSPDDPSPDDAPPLDAPPLDAPPLPREPSPPTLRAPSDPLRSPGPRVHVGVRVGAGVSPSVLAPASAVVSATASTWGRAFRAELGASYWPPVESRPSGASAPGGRLQQWTVDARGCGLVRPGPLELPLCGGLDVGAVHGLGVGVASPQRATSLRLALTAGASLVWRPARWRQRVGPWIGAEAAVALVRARFRATPASPGLVYHTPPVGGRVAAGVEVRFR